jgi:hypothetical protein
MIKRSKLMLIAAIAAAGMASPALAQTYSQRAGGAYYQRSETPRYWNGSSRYGRFNPDSPALTGGGSLGGNELMREDTQ